MKTLVGALDVSSLLQLEFRQSVRLQVRLYASDRTKGFPKAVGAEMLRDFQSDLADDTVRVIPVEWPDVHRLAEQLSDKYTETLGHRLVDILHVATALHLGVREFLTFDANQKKLAKAEGLKLPL